MKTLAVTLLDAAELEEAGGPGVAAAVVYRGGRLQVEGLLLDDQWAAAVRAAGDEYAYFKQKHVLAAHKRAESLQILPWVASVLDAIIQVGNA
jgi:hypothetical protein